MAWVEVCEAGEVDVEDVIRFDQEDRSFAVYRSDKGDYYATDGFCTHGRFHLADGLVMGKLIECPKHNGRFDITSGAAVRVPACKDLQTYPVKVEAGRVYINIE
ncbi:3-phenylpropionate/trans-cinnamate dioxygenase ferredoxin subunit [Paenibacillus taihuensis]|uniref:3-phenylpropionate/trans-cinnamate dioxygenase ferredoxin subunit n=1 Tax=Paenibacillus taihuensis TaxID=1156355 RepID=A0A3D9S3M4_9BACL|nr:MocE family 2Fe-2S type ferredoxin [Paenibacillus taihuensis]REE87385.1 3-phenylpropionate/trans-cinnamate dioxygenase ferredoxin subunit [Paenibacillus taihuensis]